MGRLTLNVLLSFAQFERELAGERIRDKFAASRRKGMWMGGTISLGYDVRDRKLVINEEEAERVRMIFRQYLAAGTVAKLSADLERHGVRSKQRILTSGRMLGGCRFWRGALYHLLQNRIYRGEVVHKGITYPGEQEAIVDEELWSAVQARLAENRGTRRKARVETGALLGGLIFDDRGHIMSPTYSLRRGNRYRYYISSALLHDRKANAGSRTRVNADEMERLVVGVLSQECPGPNSRPKAPPTVGPSQPACWCATPSSASLFNPHIFRLFGNKWRHRRLARKPATARMSTWCPCRRRGRVLARRSSFPVVGGIQRLAASISPLFSPSPVPRSGCETFAPGSMPTLRRSPVDSSSATSTFAAFCASATWPPTSSRRLSKVGSRVP
jgi:Recombinase